MFFLPLSLFVQSPEATTHIWCRSWILGSPNNHICPTLVIGLHHQDPSIRVVLVDTYS